MDAPQKVAIWGAVITATAIIIAALIPNLPPEQFDESLLDSNLINNPSAEHGLQHWQVPSSYRTRTENPPPHDGSHYFFPGANKSIVEAKQTVSLLGLRSLIDSQKISCSISAFMRDYQSEDESQVIVQFLSEAGEVIGTLESKSYAKSDIWEEYTEIYTPPARTRSAKIILRSTYRGGAENNDGYFDALSFVCTRE